MKKSLYLSLFLGIISIIAAIILSVTNNMTKGIIEQSNIKKKNTQLSSMFNTNTVFTEGKVGEGYKTIENVYVAKENDKIIGYVYEVKTKGYAGVIKYLVALNNEGKYIAFESLLHNETPGFGTKMDEPLFKEQFKKKNINDDIDGLSGATITTKGLFAGFDEVVEHFEKNYKK